MRSAHSRLSTGVVVLSLVLAACGVPAQADMPTATVPVPTSAAAVLPPAPIVTTPPPSRVSQQPTPVPACTPSAPAAPAPDAPPLEAYSFSQPEVVFRGQTIHIASWLPDNQRVLIARSDPANNRAVIETLDVTNGMTQYFASPSTLASRPFWLESAHAVAFTDFSANEKPALYFSFGNDQTITMLANDLARLNFTVGPGDKYALVALRSSPDKPVLVDLQQKNSSSKTLTSEFRVPHNIPSSEYGLRPADQLRWFQASWSPSETYIAFYNQSGLYLTVPTTGQICQISLLKNTVGEPALPFWPSLVRWSNDGRFLALLITVGDGLPFPLRHLLLLDTATMQQRMVDLGGAFVSEVSWGPEQNLAVLAKTKQDAGIPERLKLFLVDGVTGRNKHILTQETFASGLYTIEGGGLSWSPDGRYIIAIQRNFDNEASYPQYINDNLVISLVSINRGRRDLK